MTLFVLQHWTPPRTIDGEWRWTWDLADVFLTEHEARTEQVEWYSETIRTRIVEFNLVEHRVVNDTKPFTALTQTCLFAD